MTVTTFVPSQSIGEQVDRQAGYDALLPLATQLWKIRRPGPMPEPGDELTVAGDIPSAVVVSVIEPRGQARSAALLRLPTGGNSLGAWEEALTRQGWTPAPRPFG